jgi:NDP-sugar pyrophosphorylase family protein
MKALILAGGRGRRLDSLSAQKNKCMIRIHGIPALEYNLRYLEQTDIDEIILVVGYRAEEIINYYGNLYHHKKLTYVIQWEQKGLVHAIECAKDAIGKDSFLLMLGDEIMVHPRHKEMIAEFQKGHAFALCGVLRVENLSLIKRTYTLIQDDACVIHRLVEKPQTPLNNIMGTGQCLFHHAILDYIDITPIHHERKEKELPDLIQCAIDAGKVVKSFQICDQYTNINTSEDIEMAEGFTL